jgi:hypothetical protein
VIAQYLHGPYVVTVETLPDRTIETRVLDRKALDLGVPHRLAVLDVSLVFPECLMSDETIERLAPGAFASEEDN